MSVVVWLALGALPVAVMWALDRRRRGSWCSSVAELQARSEAQRHRAEADRAAQEAAYLRLVAGEEGRRLADARRVLDEFLSSVRVVPPWTIPLAKALGIDVSWTVPAQRSDR